MENTSAILLRAKSEAMSPRQNPKARPTNRAAADFFSAAAATGRIAADAAVAADAAAEAASSSEDKRP